MNGGSAGTWQLLRDGMENGECGPFPLRVRSPHRESQRHGLEWKSAAQPRFL